MASLLSRSARCLEMVRRFFLQTQMQAHRQYSEHVTSNPIKVTVLGSSGSVGEPLSLLLKHSPLISKLALHDISPRVIKVAEDLNHIETKCQVEGHLGKEELTKALAGADVVILPTGARKRPGMTHDDLFAANASTVHKLAKACARTCPNAILGIISNPVNSTVVVASEAYKKEGVYNPNKIFGITTLDVVRGNSFLAQLLGIDPAKLNLPVVGGHSGVTSVPLVSQSGIKTSLSRDQLAELTDRIQSGGISQEGSSSFARAYAAARFTFSTLRGLMGADDVVECAYVKSDVTDAPYFATPVLLGSQGMKKNLGLGDITAFEEELITKALPEIKRNVRMGEEFAPIRN